MTIQVIPTRHLLIRCRERLGDLAPELDIGRASLLSGVLVVDKRGSLPVKLYLDVDGVGRFVLARNGSDFVGVTYLPQIHCHGPLPSRAEGSTRIATRCEAVA